MSFLYFDPDDMSDLQHTNTFPEHPLKAPLLADLQSVYATFARHLERIGPVYIAGGAVRDTLLGRIPRDYDIFILVDKPMDEVALEVRKVLDAMNTGQSLKYEKKREYRTNTLLETLKRIFGGKTDDLTGATVTPVKQVTVQIILSRSESIYDLLADFDWNICLFAYGWIPHMDAIGVYEKTPLRHFQMEGELRVNAFHYPIRTLRRGFRFADRYELPINKEDLVKLAGLIVEGDGDPLVEGDANQPVTLIEGAQVNRPGQGGFPVPFLVDSAADF